MNIGDIVTLKSGGPIMTVTSIREANLIDCTWFIKDGKYDGPFFYTFNEKSLNMFTESHQVVVEEDDEYDLI